MITWPLCMRFEGVVPALEVRCAGRRSSRRLVRPAASRLDHALPDRVVVAERSLQRDVLLHQRVEVDRHQVGRPADLDDLCRRACTSFSAASSGRLAPDASQTTSAPSGSSAAHDLFERLGCRRRRRASRRARAPPRAAPASPAQAGDDQRVGAGERRHRAHSRPIGPGPEHDDRVAGLDRRVDAHRLVGDRSAARSGRRCSNGSESGIVVQAARRHLARTAPSRR